MKGRDASKLAIRFKGSQPIKLIETTNVGLYKLKISARRGAEVIERKKGIYSKRDYN
jgi:hypothetical protein